jgi:hypothetical protein
MASSLKDSGPEIFKVVRIPKNRAFFAETTNSIVWEHDFFFGILYSGTCSIPEFLEDWRTYGPSQFDSEFVVYGLEF